jgi:hypothetical protein
MKVSKIKINLRYKLLRDLEDSSSSTSFIDATFVFELSAAALSAVI